LPRPAQESPQQKLGRMRVIQPRWAAATAMGRNGLRRGNPRDLH
jgi:hypothetical protein